jgi:hypothetical protein
MLCLPILQPIIRSGLSGDPPAEYPMCSTLDGDTTTDYPLCLSILQPTFRFAFSVVTTTDSPLYSTCRYYNRLSALISPAVLQATMLCALLCLAKLQPSLCSALPVDFPTNCPPLYSACRYYN